MIEERRKIEFITSVVGGFRGLPMMLFGAAMVIFMILNYIADLAAQARNNYGKDLTLTFGFALICLIFRIFGYPKIREYYRHKYGHASAKPRTYQDTLQDLIYLTPFLIGFFFGVPFDTQFQLPLSITVLSVGLFAFGLWWANYRGISSAVLYLSVSLSIAAFLPWEKIFFAVTVLDDYSARSVFFRTVCSTIYGITYIVMGWTDWHFMTKTLKPVSREENIYEPV